MFSFTRWLLDSCEVCGVTFPLYESCTNNPVGGKIVMIVRTPPVFNIIELGLLDVVLSRCTLGTSSLSSSQDIFGLSKDCPLSATNLKVQTWSNLNVGPG